MKILLALSLVLSTTGCAKTAPMTPYSLYTLPFNALATLEDFCEDPIEDAQTLTPLEATVDMFSLPIHMVMYTLRFATYLTVGVGMVLAGKDSKATIDQINWVLPVPHAGPNPDRVRYHPGMVRQEGCL